MAIPQRKPLPSVRKQALVNGDVRQHPVEGLVIHRHAAHQCQYRVLIGHCGSHAGYSAEVTVEAFDPVGGVYHRLYLRGVIEISQIRLVIRIAAQEPDVPIVLAPSVPQPGPRCLGRFYGIIALSGAEYVPEIGCKTGLVTMSDLGEQVAFQVCHATL